MCRVTVRVEGKGQPCCAAQVRPQLNLTLIGHNLRSDELALTLRPVLGFTVLNVSALCNLGAVCALPCSIAEQERCAQGLGAVPDRSRAAAAAAPLRGRGDRHDGDVHAAAVVAPALARRSAAERQQLTVARGRALQLKGGGTLHHLMQLWAARLPLRSPDTAGGASSAAGLDKRGLTTLCPSSRCGT